MRERSFRGIFQRKEGVGKEKDQNTTLPRQPHTTYFHSPKNKDMNK